MFVNGFLKNDARKMEIKRGKNDVMGNLKEKLMLNELVGGSQIQLNIS